MNIVHQSETGPPTTWGRAACCLVVALGLTGCHSMGKKSPQVEPPRVLDAAAGVGAESTSTDSGFRREVGVQDQMGAHMDLARAHETRGDLQAAVNAYAKAIEVAEKTGSRKGEKISTEQKALAYRRMAAALDRAGRFAQSETHYATALKLSPDDARVWNDAGYSSYLQGKYTEATRRLRKAESLAPEEPRVHTNLGLCLAAAGKNDEALAALSKAGGPAIGHANLAYILAAMGQTTEARRHYEIALKFQPALEPARVALAQLDAQGASSVRTEQIASMPTAPTPDVAISRTSTITTSTGTAGSDSVRR